MSNSIYATAWPQHMFFTMDIPSITYLDHPLANDPTNDTTCIMDAYSTPV